MDKFQWLQVASRHDVNYPGLEHQLSGFVGESEFASWLDKYGCQDWLVYRNFWLFKGYQEEIDFLIISRSKWVMIEVKNYDCGVVLGESSHCGAIISWIAIL